MPVNAEQIRQLLTEISDQDDSSDEDEVSGTQRTGRSAARGLGSNSTAEPKGAAAGRQDRGKLARRKHRVEGRLRFLKKVHGGSLIAVNDQAPDPGCSFEARWYLQFRDPKFFAKKKGGLQMELASTYLPDDPEIRRITEEYRETHWKLAAPKGFAALQGLPELQQLLAYTAADVVHYCTARRLPDDPPRFERFFGSNSSSIQRAESILDSDMLHNKSSLFGQLCPGLQLCLAAEVATGLMCDSQPPPPDTPEHGSALLLFLAAALRQVERECYQSRGQQLAWITDAGDRIPALKQLCDLCLCLNPQTSLQLLQQTAAQGLADKAAPWGCDSSSSRSSAPAGGASSGSSPAGAASGSSADGSAAGSCNGDCAHDKLQPEDWGQSNVLLAAMEVAAALLQPCSTGSPTGSSGMETGGCSSSTEQQAGELQEGQTLAVSASDACAAPAAGLPQLLQQVQRAYQQRQQELEQRQQQHEQQTTDGAAGQPASTAVSELVGYITSMVDEFCEQYILNAPGENDGDSVSDEKEGESASHVDPTAPSQSPEPIASSEAAADSVAWHVAVVTGALALMRMLQDARGRSGVDASSPVAAAELVRELCPVQAALLFAAVEGLYFRVRQDLMFCLADGRVKCQCELCVAKAQEQQQQQQPEHPRQKLVASCKAEIASKILMLLQLVQSFRDVRDAAAAPTVPATASAAQQPTLLQAMERDIARRHEVERAAIQALEAQSQDQSELEIEAQMQAMEAWITASLVLRHEDAAPLAWFKDFFQRCGEQQLSPLCLLQAANVAAAAAAAAAAAGDAAGVTTHGGSGDGAGSSSSQRSMPGDADAKCMTQTWQSLQHVVAKRVGQQLAERLTQQGSAQSAAASSELLGAAGGAAAESAQQPRPQPSYMVLQYLKEEAFQRLLQPLLIWQRQWARVENGLAEVMEAYEDDFEIKLQRRLRERRSLLRKERREERAQLASQGSAAGKQQQLLERTMLRGGASSDSSVSSDDELFGTSKGSGAAAEQTDAAASGTKGSSRAAEPDDKVEPEQSCPACKAEEAGQPLAQLINSYSSSSSSSSSSGGGSGGSSSSGGSGCPQAAGLYSALPVSWSDPCMMRRLLWGLLGKLKPTAQAWFKTHYKLCPHRQDIFAWHAVVVSLARHIWAPPGPWGPEHEAQMWLLLPSKIRDVWHLEQSSREETRVAARNKYAWALNAGFDDQSGNAQAAAVLSLHALLALDPHGARVQPRPELLFYTPAGFHAAVCKTLMQALQVPAVPVPTPPAEAAEAAAEAAAPAAPAAPAPAEAAAAAAEAKGDSQQEGGSEGAEKPLSQALSSADDFPSPHYLQAWSDVLFPAWYLWWHIGLLAYHQQQLQQQLAQSSSTQQRRQTKQQQQQLRDTPAGLQALEPQQQGQAAAWQHLRGQQHATVSAAGTLRNSSNCSGRRGSASGGSSGGSGGSSANRAGGAGEGSSSGSGSVAQPVPLQDLYNDPNARLFAVGYAARQVSSGAQLERLLSNPPRASALQMVANGVRTPLIQPEQACSVCQQQLKADPETGFLVDIYVCGVCGEVQCRIDCTTTHDQGCTPLPVRKAAAARKWSILDLLSPPGVPQQQPGAQLSTAAAAPAGIPPALNRSLPVILHNWSNAAQQQPGQPAHTLRFMLYSSDSEVAAFHAWVDEEAAKQRKEEWERRQQLHVAGRHSGARAGGVLSDDVLGLQQLLRGTGTSFVQLDRSGDILHMVDGNGIYREGRFEELFGDGQAGYARQRQRELQRRAQLREQSATLQARREARAQHKGQLAASPIGPDRPGTPEQQQGVIAPAGRYGPMAAAAAGDTSVFDELD